MSDTKLRAWDEGIDGPPPVFSQRRANWIAVRISNAEGEWYGWENPDTGDLSIGSRVLNSAAKQAEIDAAIAERDAKSPLRIGWYIEGGSVIYDPPLALDYTRALDTRLEPVITVEVDGEVREIEYRGPDPENPTGPLLPIVRESYTYNRDAAGFAQSRTLLIEWIRTSGPPHPVTKTRPKSYTARESIREGKTRRSNVVDNLELVVAGYLLATEVIVPETDPAYIAQRDAALNLGREFLKSARAEISDFVEASVQDILTTVASYSAPSIQNAPAPWMDTVVAAGPVTIRDVILNTINIWD